MDTLRGTFDSNEPADARAFDDESLDTRFPNEADEGRDEEIDHVRPPEIGQDERRMQVRAYNHWAGLLEDRIYPDIEDLDPDNLPDFGPYSVVLDFTQGLDDPFVRFLGSELGAECGAQGTIDRLSDVPPRSLLSRITDHYMQILANQAPIGFEAEFVNQRGTSILYRGILLPFSSNDESIDFICGVINWKEMADADTADELLLEIDQALDMDEPEAEASPAAHRHHSDMMTDWADSPAHEEGSISEDEPAAYVAHGEAGAPSEAEIEEQGSLGLASIFGAARETAPSPLSGGLSSLPDFDKYGLEEPEDEEEGEEEGSYSFASLSDYIDAPAKKVVDLDADSFDPADYRVEDHSDNASVAQPADIPDPVADIANTLSAAAEAEAEAEAEADEQQAPFGDLTEHSGEQDNTPSEPVLAPSPLAQLKSEPEPMPAAEPVQETDTAQSETSLDLSAYASDPVSTLATPEAEAAILEPAPVEEVPAGPALAAFKPQELGDNADLMDCLASARELAHSARASEDRSRHALYAAVSRAYDVSLAAKDDPDRYAQLIEENDLTVQDRAPMTPVVKLVFGSDYDKTRLTEYAAVLSHAHRLELKRGALSGFLAQVEGGLKGVVSAERRLRREESGKSASPEAAIRASLARQLRALEALTFEAIDAAGPEFALVMVRRDGQGQIDVLGEIEEDIALIERAGKRLVA